MSNCVVKTLEDVLSSEERDCIPAHIFAKVKICFEENFEEYLTWKALFESSKSKHEQKSSALAKELEDCKAVQTADQAKLVAVQTDLTALKAKYESAEAELLKLRDSVGRLECENNVLHRKQVDAEDERDSLLKIVERRKVEIERLELDVKRLNAELTTAVDAHFEGLAAVDGVKSREASVKVKEQAMQSEREFYLTKIDNLVKDLDKSEVEMSTLRKDHALRLLTLETQLAAKTEELRIATEKDRRLTENNRELTLKIENLAARLMTMRESESAMNENYQQELRAKIKLVELYKNMVDDLNGKIEELTEAIQCLQNLVEEAGKHCDEVEAKRSEEQEKHEEVVKAKDKCIAALKNELKDANNLINALKQDAVEITSEEKTPPSLAISKLIRSGLTVTQIYTQFVSVGEELLSVKEENKKLNQTISSIFKELEEKAPVILEQNHNYENAVECVTSVCKQNDDLIEECHQLRAELTELKRSAGNNQREKDLMRLKVQDLSQQVCFLLKEVEEARGGVVRLDEDVSSNDYAEANDVISDRLVIFRDVVDLQAKNTQLLTILRSLSARLEELENAQKDVDITALQENIKNLNSEVTNLRESSSQLQEKLEEVGEQRDMYRDMYEETVKGLSTSQQLAQRLEETEVSLKAAKTLNDELREERESMDQMWSDQMKAWTTKIQDLTTENFTLVTQGECEVEKRKVLKKTIDGHKKEIAAVEEKCTNYRKTITKHEQTIKQLADESKVSQAKLCRAKAEVESLREENRLLREAEARICLEKESSERGSTSRALLMEHVDAIKMALEKSEAEGKMRLELRLEDSNREMKALRKRLLEEQDHFRALAAELERKTELAAALREKDRAIADQATSEALTLRRELSKAQREIEEKDKLIGQLRDAAPMPTVVVQKKDESGVRVRELEGKLTAATNQLKSFQDQLAEAKEHCRQYRGFSESLESQLQELKMKHEKEVAELEKALSESQNAEKDLKDKLEVMEDRIAEMEVDGSETVMELTQRADQVEMELEEMRKEKAVAEQERDGARVQLDEIAAQLLSATDARKMAEEKYAEEVLRHKEDVEAKDALRRELALRENEVAELRATNELLQQDFAAQHASLIELGRKMDGELRDVKERLEEVGSQNNLLHDQLRVLGAQLALSEGKAPASEITPEQGSSTQLLEVIDFLRRESHLSATRVAALDAENKRLRSEVEELTKQAAETKEALKEAERKATTEKAASLRHAEMLRQVEMMATIKESNKALRADRDALREKEQQLEERVAQLESKLAPLEEQNRSLMSQADSARAENVALSEVNKQLRTKMKVLLERENKTNLEDSKRLQNELAAERDAHSKTRDEARSVRQEKAKLEELLNAANRRIPSLESDLRAAQANDQKQSEELGVLRGKVTGLEAEVVQLQNKITKLEEVRRIARRYKAQYDEANKKNEELQKELSEKQQANAAAAGSTSLSAEAQEQLREEGRREAEEKLRGTQTSQEEQSRGSEQRLSDQGPAPDELLVQARGEVDTLRQENEALRQREENLRNVMMKVRTRLTTLDSDKTKLEQQLKEANNTSQLHFNDSEENKKRFNVLKSQYESKLARMEKDKTDALAERGERERSERERLQRELDTMTARCSLLQRQLDKQSGKASMGSGCEKGSTEPPPTPPTANIKPMAGPSSAPPKQQKWQQMFQIQQAATVPPWRAGNETPLASIRPIQTRMAAVSPQTTSNLQSSTAVLVPMQSPTQHHVPTAQPQPPAQLQQPPHQPQQAVQPQPPSSQIQVAAQQPTLVHAMAPVAVSAQTAQPTALSQQPVTVQPATDPAPVALSSGSGSMEATSSRVDLVPATSSAKQQVGAVPSTSRGDGSGAHAQSTQDVEVEGMVAVAAIPNVPQAAPPVASPAASPAAPTLTGHAAQPTTPQAKQQQPTHQRSSSQQPNQQHAVAMVMPRERTEQAVQQQVPQAVVTQPQQPPPQQPTAAGTAPVVMQQQSSQLASSSSAVTTSGSQGGLKRAREPDGEGPQGRTEPGKVVPQTKRSRRDPVTGELFQAVESSDCGHLEVEYQVPTSSQRDQEDDVIVITSDEDEDDEDERMDEEEEEEDFGEEDTSDEGEMESYPIESYDQDDLGTYDDEESSDEEHDVDNEVEIIDDSNEVPSQTVGGQPGRTDVNQAVGSSLVLPQQLLPQQVALQPEEPQQRSEATSSGVENRGDVGTPAESGSMSRSSVVTSQGLAFLGRGRTTNQQQLLLPHGYEGDTSDDSIVPSTPTLYDPRRADTDGFGVAASSPQVPSAGRFTFSESNQPTTARAGAPQVGCEGIDHTRVDLSQLEETGTERSVPTTPLDVSRQDEGVGETLRSGAAGLSGDTAVVIAVSEAGPSQGSAVPLIPAITVTGTDEQPGGGGDQENLLEEQEQMVEEPPQEHGEIPIHEIEEENGDGVSSEGQNLSHPLRPLAEEGREAEASTASSHELEAGARGGQTARRASRVGFSRRGRAVGRQKQPIVWTEPGSSASSSRGSSSTAESETVYRSGALGRGMTQNEAYPSRGQRGRRMRPPGFRGFPPY